MNTIYMIHYIYRTLLLCCGLLLWGATDSQAQQYPVQSITRLVPPYSMRLSDYYTGHQARLSVTLTNQDMLKPQLRIRLRMVIEGQGILLRSLDQGQYPDIVLDAGIPQTVSLQDLEPYFSPDNLQIEGLPRGHFQQQGALPDGYYRFMFQAIDRVTGEVLSRPQFAMAWLTQGEPPMLSLPRTGSSIAYRDPQNIVFQWTPRHLASPGAMGGSEYEFTLVEIWDDGIPAEVAFRSSTPLYQTVVYTSTLLYGPAQPPLLPGKRYAWRVRVQSREGVEEQSVFKNNGFSEIYTFVHERPQSIPSNLSAVPQPQGRADLSWMVDVGAQGPYEVSYRVAGSDNAWFTQSADATQSTLSRLRENTDYEVRVGIRSQQGPVLYSPVQQFKTLSTRRIDPADCGVRPDIRIENREPKSRLIPGDHIMAGDYKVVLLEISGADGRFGGTGYVDVPYLGNTRLAVHFDNIEVNSDNQLVSGMIRSLYDEKKIDFPTWDEAVAEAKENIGGLINDLKMVTVGSDTKEINKIVNAIRDQAKEILSEESADRVEAAGKTMTESKQKHSAAVDVLKDPKATAEEKEQAQKDKDKAELDFMNAKSEVDAVSKEISKRSKESADLILKAIKEMEQESKQARQEAAATNEKYVSQFEKGSVYEKPDKQEEGMIILDQWIFGKSNILNKEMERQLSEYYANAMDVEYYSLIVILSKSYTTDGRIQLLGSVVLDDKDSTLIKQVISLQREGISEVDIIKDIKQRISKLLKEIVSDEK